MLRLLANLLFLLALLGAAAAAGAAKVPGLAPGLMTMETMTRAFEIGAYVDEGTCDFWAVNFSAPHGRIERAFPCGFSWDWREPTDDGYAYVHETLRDLETGRVFRVPEMPRGNMEEWYRVDGHMLTEGALRFSAASAGVLMPPPGARGSLVMGWVESGGERGGEERLVHPRDLREVGVETVDGIQVVAWESAFGRVRTGWHGYDAYLTEEVRMLSDPRTAWILRMERHVLVEMTPSQIAKALGVAPPAPLPGQADEMRPVMELVYGTSDAGASKHVEEDVFFRNLMGAMDKWPVGVKAGLVLVVLGLVGAAGLSRLARKRLERRLHHAGVVTVGADMSRSQVDGPA